MTEPYDFDANPTCETCGGEVSVLIGLPVWVTFQEGTATIGTDLSELPSYDADDLSCSGDCGNPRTNGGHLTALLRRVCEVAAPELEVTL